MTLIKQSKIISYTSLSNVKMEDRWKDEYGETMTFIFAFIDLRTKVLISIGTITANPLYI